LDICKTIREWRQEGNQLHCSTPVQPTKTAYKSHRYRAHRCFPIHYIAARPASHTTTAPRCRLCYHLTTKSYCCHPPRCRFPRHPMLLNAVDNGTHLLPSTPPSIAYKNAPLAAPLEAKHLALDTNHPHKSPIPTQPDPAI